jgi:tyrosyl-tRNA synthetase
MSKSLGNAIGVTESPEDMYGKLMSISDALMLEYHDRLGSDEWSELRDARARLDGEEGDALAFKHALALRIVERFQGREAAARGAEHFRRVVQRGEIPEEVPEHRLPVGDAGGTGLLELMERLGFTRSRGEARRLVNQGAVHLDGQAVEDPTLRLAAGSYLIRVGKRRYARVELH